MGGKTFGTVQEKQCWRVDLFGSYYNGVYQDFQVPFVALR